MGVQLGSVLLGLGALRIGGRAGFEQLGSYGWGVWGCLIMVILVILAHFTNPTEGSFRAYLTELSFRNHLLRLHSSLSPEPSPNGTATPDIPLAHTSNPPTPPAHINFPLHAAHKLSVTLRTPAYLFRSFALFSVVVVSPNASGPTAKYEASDVVAEMAGAWYIGAFGRWWFCGELPELDARGRKIFREEKMRAGLKKVRLVEDSDDDAFLDLKGASASYEPPPNATPPKPTFSPPSRRRRDRHKGRRSSGPDLEQGRSRSPSPNPANRIRRQVAPLPERARPPAASPEPLSLPPPAASSELPHSPPTPPPTEDPAQSPAVLDILARISASEAQVAELHAQIAQSHTFATASHAQLQSALEDLRAKKREEDAFRSDLKNRTKSLEESKRQAEATKRDAERKLQAAVKARDAVLARMSSMAQEMEELRQCIADNAAAVSASEEEVRTRSDEIDAEIAHKKEEIRVAEDVVAALGVRVREYEDLVAEEKVKLERARGERDARRRELDAAGWNPYSIAHGPATATSDHSSPPSYGHSPWDYSSPVHNTLSMLQRRRAGTGNPSSPTDEAHDVGSGFASPTMSDASISTYRPFLPHRDSYSDFGPAPHASVAAAPQTPPPGSHGIYDTASIVEHTNNHGIAFPHLARAVDGDVSLYNSNLSFSPPRTPSLEGGNSLLSPLSTSLLPSNLFRQLEGDASPDAFGAPDDEVLSTAISEFGLASVSGSDASASESESEAVVTAAGLSERRGRKLAGLLFPQQNGHTSTSKPPSPPRSPGLDEKPESPHIVISRPTSPAAAAANATHVSFAPFTEEDGDAAEVLDDREDDDDATPLYEGPAQLYRTVSDPVSTKSAESSDNGSAKGPRRWFTKASTTPAAPSLNPDAKVFSFSRPLVSSGRSGWGSRSQSSDPAGFRGGTASAGFPSPELGAGPSSSSGSFFSSLRAFAPSAAEREQLKRAMANSKSVDGFGTPSPWGAEDRHSPQPGASRGGGFSISPFASPSQSAQSSMVDLAHAWAQEPDIAAVATAPSPARRGFSKFFARKPSKAKVAEAAESEAKTEAGMVAVDAGKA